MPMLTPGRPMPTLTCAAAGMIEPSSTAITAIALRILVLSVMLSTFQYAAGSSQKLRLQRVPVETVRATHLAKRVEDTRFHALEPAHVNVAIVVLQHLRDLVGARADAVLHVDLRRSRRARECEIDVDEVLR